MPASAGVGFESRFVRAKVDDLSWDRAATSTALHDCAEVDRQMLCKIVEAMFNRNAPPVLVVLRVCSSRCRQVEIYLIMTSAERPGCGSSVHVVSAEVVRNRPPSWRMESRSVVERGPDCGGNGARVR